MNRREAKQVLLRYRPGTSDERDPDIASALELAERDPELGRWLEEHLAFQQTMQAKFRGLPVPAHLKDSILAEGKIVPVAFWRRPPVWLAAAVLVLFLGLTALVVPPRTPDRFADFRSRMVRTALRQYSMDIVTSDMRQLRQFLTAQGAPADYALPSGLRRLSLTGGGSLKWRSQPVAMVCFDRGDGQMLFLFVLGRDAVKDAPPPAPRVAKVNKLVTASWSEADKTYVLAGPDEAEFAEKYL